MRRYEVRVTDGVSFVIESSSVPSGTRVKTTMIANGISIPFEDQTYVEEDAALVILNSLKHPMDRGSEALHPVPANHVAAA